MHIDFNKKNGLRNLGCLIYKTAYSLRQFLPPDNAENGDIKHSDFWFINMAALLAVHVFVCDVTGVPCGGRGCEYDNHLKFVLYCTGEPKYMYHEYLFMKLKATFFDFIFAVPFTSSF